MKMGLVFLTHFLETNTYQLLLFYFNKKQKDDVYIHVG